MYLSGTHKNSETLYLTCVIDFVCVWFEGKAKGLNLFKKRYRIICVVEKIKYKYTNVVNIGAVDLGEKVFRNKVIDDDGQRQIPSDDNSSDQVRYNTKLKSITSRTPSLSPLHKCPLHTGY